MLLPICHSDDRRDRRAGRRPQHCDNSGVGRVAALVETRARCAWTLGLLVSCVGPELWRASILGAPEARFGVLPCRVIAQAGLRWCDGWRRANFRGSHDQAKIQDQSHPPFLDEVPLRWPDYLLED